MRYSHFLGSSTERITLYVRNTQLPALRIYEFLVILKMYTDYFRKNTNMIIFQMVADSVFYEVRTEFLIAPSSCENGGREVRIIA